MVRLGPPAPWVRLPAAVRHYSLADVRRVCATLRTPKRLPATVPGMQAAAVLMALFEEDTEARVILTKRPDTMPSHRGDVAFPGGKFQPELDGSLVDAALREAEEEVGLPPSAVEIVAELDTLSTVVTRFVVAPFVGLLDRRPVLTPHPGEVVRVFDVALADLVADGVHREEHWGTSGPMARPVHFFELPGVHGDPENPADVIWGATARILVGFLAVLTGSGQTPG